MPVVTWKSNCVFASRYFQESSATQDYIRQFGPLVVAGDRLHRRPPQLMLQVVVVILSTRLIRVRVLDLFACFLNDSSHLFLRAMVHVESIVLPSPDSISAGVTFYLVYVLP